MSASHSNGAHGTALLWPYDEVTVRIEEPGRRAKVLSPWMTADVALDPSNVEGVTALAAKFGNESLAPGDLALVQWFFAAFDPYPLCYTLPTPKGPEARDTHRLDDESLLALPFVAFLERVTAEALPEEGLNPSPLASASAWSAITPVRARWEWDTDAALAFATTPEGTIHPESVLSVARRYHLLDVISGNEGRSHFSSIESMPAEDFRLAAGLMVRQNHHVTRMCRTALLPAIGKAAGAREAIEAFIAEENGHDVILGAALKALAADPEALPVSDETRALMRLLRFTAGRNALAFAMAVDCFERNTFEEADPLASLLRKGGFEAAAKHVNRHKAINDAGGHENVARGFLATMAPCDPGYALEALKLAEAVSVVISAIPASAMALYESLRT